MKSSVSVKVVVGPLRQFVFSSIVSQFTPSRLASSVQYEGLRAGVESLAVVKEYVATGFALSARRIVMTQYLEESFSSVGAGAPRQALVAVFASKRLPGPSPPFPPHEYVELVQNSPGARVDASTPVLLARFRFWRTPSLS